MEVNQSTVSMVSLIFSSLIVGGVAWKFWREYNSAKVELKRGASFKEITDWSLTPAMAAGMKIVGALAMLILLHNFVSQYVVGKTTTGTVVAGTSVVLDTIGSSAKSAASAIGDAASAIGGSFSSEPINAETVLDMAENNSLIRIDTSGASSAPISGSAPISVSNAPAAAPEPESAAPVTEMITQAAPAPAIQGPASPFRNTTVAVSRGDTLYAIAKQAYGNGELWPGICKANPAVFASGCNTITAGQVLIIPPIHYAATIKSHDLVGHEASDSAVAAESLAYGPMTKPEDDYVPANIAKWATPEGGSWGVVVLGATK